MKILMRILNHGLLICFVLLLFMPLYLALVAASHEGTAMMQAPLPVWPGHRLFDNIKTVLTQGIAATGGQPIWQMLVNSFIMAVLIASGKIILALLSAFALVYFQFPLKGVFLP